MTAQIQKLAQSKQTHVPMGALESPIGVGARQVAKMNYVRIAPRKVRSVGDLIQGLSVNEAEAQLLVERRRAAKALLKLLRSAMANAKHNQRLNPDQLFIESLRVDQGPMVKRFLPRARGMATPIQKKTSHVTLVLAEGRELPPARFTIQTPKKVKLSPGEKPKKEKAKESGKEGVASRPKAPGFFKRVFSRKSGTGK